MKSVDNKYLFEEMPVVSAVKTMAIPTIMGQVIVLIYSIADTFFIGRTNNPFMVASASLVLPLFNITIPLAALAGVGGGALISRLLGEKREKEAEKVSSFSIYFSIIVSLAFSIFVLFMMEPLLLLMGAGDETLEYAKYYTFFVIVIGALPTIMTNVFSNLVRSIGESSKAGFGVTLGGVVNIILDPIFMFVILPDGYEVVGAGIATCLSNFISCTYFVTIVYKLKEKSVLKLLGIHIYPAKESILKIFSIGVPSAVVTLLFDVDYIVLDKLMSGYSDIALAAVGIVLKAERLPLNIGIGICQGMVPIVAYNYASKNYKRMNEISRFSLFVGIVCAIISIILYEIFAPYIMRFFIADIDTVTLGTTFLRIRCIATVFMFMCFYHVHLFNGYGQGKYALFLGIMRWAVFNIPMLYIMNYFVGIYGLVWSQTIADIFTVILSVAVHKRYRGQVFSATTYVPF